MNPAWIVLVRGVRAYLQTLVGLLSAGATGMTANVLPAHDFFSLLKVCAGLSLASAVMCVLQNALELLASWDEKLPHWRG